jgi:hypothetical protein
MLATYLQYRFAQPIFRSDSFWWGERPREPASAKRSGDGSSVASPHRNGKLRHRPIFGVELSARAFTLRP